MLELMSEARPLLLQQHQKPIDGPVIRIQHNLRQGSHLSGAVPPVTAVHKNRMAQEQTLSNAG